MGGDHAELMRPKTTARNRRKNYARRQAGNSTPNKYIGTQRNTPNLERRPQMPTQPITTEVMRRLPEALRPNPHSIDTECMNLSANAWTPDQIVASIMKRGAREPGHVVSHLRYIEDLPPNPTSTPIPEAPTGHTPCPTHGPPCQLCYCETCSPRCNLDHTHHPDPQHHISVPAPDYIKAMFGNGIT